MKQRILHLNNLWRVVLCGCLAAAIAPSCVDNTYDLDKDISTEVTVLNGLVIPIGTIDSIFLSDMIDPDSIDMLSIIDGQYVISMKDTVDMSIDLMDEDSEISITIDKVDTTIVKTIADDTTFPSFVIETEESTPVSLGLSQIKLADNDAPSLDASTNLSPNLSTEMQKALELAPYTETDLGPFELPVEFSPISQSINLSPSVDCPSIVKSISDIRFGEGGEGVDVVITFDISSFADSFTGFEWNTPEIVLTFPEDFVLSSDSNVATFPVTKVEGGLYEATTQILSYDAELAPNALTVAGGITCEISGDLEVLSARTDKRAVDLTTPFSLTVTSDDITIGDFDITVSGLEFEIEQVDINSVTTVEDLSENIKSVDYVEFDSKSNNFDISIDQITLPNGLGIVGEAEYVTLTFPKKRFVISGATSDDDNYYVEIPTTELIGSSSYAQSIYIEQILLSDCEIDENRTMTIDPEVEMTGAMVNIGGKLSLLDYNSYVTDDADYNNQTINVSAKALDLDVTYAELTTTAIQIELPAQDTTIVISEEIPSELVALYSLEFQEEVTAKFSIDIEGLPTDDSAGDISFVDYTIEFPSFLVFDEASGIGADNTLVFNDVIGDKTQSIRSFAREYEIERIDFTGGEYDKIITVDEDDNTYLEIDVKLKMSGDMELESGSVGSDIDNIECKVLFEISPIKVGKVSGKVAPEMPEIAESVDLSDLSEMSLGDAEITLSNPSISITVQNPLAIGMTLDTLSLIPYKDGVALDAIETTEVIYIDAADIDSDSYAETTVVLEAKPSSVAGHYQLSGLETLLETLPDSLQIAAVANIADGVHTIDLAKTSYNLNLIYDVNVPLEFDKFLIQYSDTLSDLASSLESIVEIVSNLELQLEITNTFPFSIEVASMTALDSLNVVLPLDDMFPADNKISGSADGTAVVSQFDIRLSDNSAGDLARLDALLFDVKASIASSQEAVALKEGQFMMIGVKICLPDGLSFDIDELMNGDEDEDEDESNGWF
ncbi:MAG: hypothetical protein SNH63_06575 [Rikenellaceae bacterium]